MSESASDSLESSRTTVTVQVWERSLAGNFGEMDPDNPDKEIEIPVFDGSEFWSPDHKHVLATSIQNHQKYAFHVKNAHALDEGVTVQVFSNDSPHAPDDWGRPIEGGLHFPSGTEEPFKVELWGRIKIEVEQS